MLNFQRQSIPLQAAMQQAAAKHQSGRLQEAQQLYRDILKDHPSLEDAHRNLLIILHSTRQIAEMEQQALAMIEHLPKSGFAWKGLGLSQLMQGKDAVHALQMTTKFLQDDAEAHDNLGIALKRAGRLEDATISFRRAIKFQPRLAGAYVNLGNTLKDLGKLDDALLNYRHAIAIQPELAEVHYNMAIVLRDLGQLDGAVESYRRALRSKPDWAETHYNLGVVLNDQGLPAEAVKSYRRALEIKPNLAEAQCNLGNALKQLGQLDDAVTSYRRAIEIKPDYAEAYNNLAAALIDLGQVDVAIENFRLALEIKPDYAEAHSSLGNALKDLGQIDDALKSYRLALEINPNYAEGHSNLGNALQEFGQLDEAVASHSRALEIKPDFAEVHSNLGYALLTLGRLDEAMASYHRAVEIKPDYAKAHSDLLFCISHNESYDAQALLAEHCRFGEKFEAPLRASWPQHQNLRDPERCLRVGFVSADLYNHPVASFFEPLLAHLVEFPSLSLTIYYNNTREDPVTQRLRGLSTQWRAIAPLSDAAVAQKIAEDGIDILIDLSGHTGKNRLLSFARKPAPVQASWMGYPGTTGLQAMDYYLADRFFMPPGQFDAQFMEKIVRLPATAPFLPDAASPPVNALPAMDNGYVSFGSFNRMNKLSPAVIALWSQLLRALPDARMVLGGMPENGNNEHLIDWFQQQGIARERLSFYPRSDMPAYLALHHQVDICLDAFPYAGSTTTLHALWMGVPTLTLAGRTLAGRAGATILGYVGLEEFVARDHADFVQKGLAAVADISALAQLRAGLRERFGQSAIGRPEVIAAGLERALRTMWQRWCAGQPVESIEVEQQDIRQDTQKNKQKNVMQEADK
jgi:protein O-GlcNAc transferase